MERTLTYVMTGALVEGRALLGHYRLSQSVQVTRVRVQARTIGATRPGVTPGVTRISLEADGVPTGLTVDVARGAEAGAMAEATASARLTVPAAAELRWRCVASPGGGLATEEGLEEWNVAMTCADPGTDWLGAAELTVRWRDGREDLLLYQYDAASGEFDEVNAGQAASRATVAGGANFAVTFAGASGPVIQARNDDLLLGLLVDNGLTATSERRLEFWIRNGLTEQRVGTLTEAGVLRVRQATEIGSSMDMPLGTDRFVWRYGGQARAVLGMSGVDLVAAAVTESATGTRGTEEGARRVTEEGDTRVTEGA